jgi:hypothetical protein
MAGIPSRSIEAVCQNPTPAISFTASSVDNLSRISSILTLAKSEGGMDCVRTEYGGTLLTRPAASSLQFQVVLMPIRSADSRPAFLGFIIYF